MHIELNFALTILKNHQDIIIEFDGTDYIAKGETFKHNTVLKACYFVWYSRREEWIFNPWHSSRNPMIEYVRKKLKKEYGVDYA
ncbi:MAG: hypothetical protein ACRC4T_08205 [Cetobacterium sp.]